ncbi:MAG: response regulator, partial [Myxococcales bacterium]|nr:response regulator [Myxococcales bacterium]
MASRVEILIIEDDEDDFILTRELILDIDVDAYAIEWASTFEAGLARLATRTFDVCLVDFRLGARTGVELLREARGRGHELPVIFLTGQREHEFDVEAMRAGASDYLVKGELMPIQLERSIRYAIERARALAELRELN